MRAAPIAKRNISKTSVMRFPPRTSYPSLEAKKQKGQDEEPGFKITRTTHMHSNEKLTPQYPGQSGGGSVGLVSREYVGSREEDSLPEIDDYRGRRRTKNVSRKDEFDEFRETHDIKFQDLEDHGGEGEGWQEMDAIDELTIRSKRKKESTITNSEREAFHKIFADIFTRYQAQTPNEYTPRDPFEEDEDEDFGTKTWDPQQESQNETKDPRKTAKAKLDDIMKDVMYERPSRSQLEEIVQRYPPPLRAAASRAVGLDKLDLKGENNELLSDGGSVPMEPAVHSALVGLQNAEQLRVETLMRNAETDFALWGVLEAEVFPLIEKLGLGKVRNNAPKEETEKESTTSKKFWKKGKKSKGVEKPAESSVGNKTLVFDKREDGISSLELYGPLYPSYLLLALRLLDRSFTKPSPLTLSLLPKIKSLGIISQVLGASTQLYNELITIYWHRRDNFRGVLDLLEEMEQSGLSWDQETLTLVDDMRRLQRAAHRGDRGDTSKALFRFSEFAPGGFDSWALKIRRSLKSDPMSALDF